MGYNWNQFNDLINNDREGVRGRVIDEYLDPERVLSNVPGRGWFGGYHEGEGQGHVFDLGNDKKLRKYANKHKIIRIEADADGNITPIFENERAARRFNELRTKAIEDLAAGKMTYANRSDDTYESPGERSLRLKAESAKKSGSIEDLLHKVIESSIPPKPGEEGFEEYREWWREKENRKDERRMNDLGAARKWSNRKGATNTVGKVLQALI
tara:strand:+ start:585 stop:1220 length:636 start_codon:yes stop_codon:yes gene_type:complete